MNNLKIICSVRSECGPNRERNEDSIFPEKSGSSDLPFEAAMCDGLGGHVKGEVASKIATDSMDTEENDVSKIINDANIAIANYQKDNLNSNGMGTTMMKTSEPASQLGNPFFLRNWRGGTLMIATNMAASTGTTISDADFNPAQTITKQARSRSSRRPVSVRACGIDGVYAHMLKAVKPEPMESESSLA